VNAVLSWNVKKDVLSAEIAVIPGVSNETLTNLRK